MSRIMFVMPPMEGTTGIRLPLGIAYLSAIVKRAGHEVKCVDLSIGDKNFQWEIESFKPDFIGFNTVTPTIEQVWALCEAAKAWNKDVKTILGGPHVSSLPEESISRDTVDFVISQDGEDATLKIIEGKIKPGIVEGGLEMNLDDLPFPDWSDFTLDAYWTVLYKGRIMPIESSRGCPYNCIYCNKVFGYKMRTKSPKRFFEELKHMKERYNPDIIEIIDDLFTFNKKRVIEICKLIMDNNLDIKWSCPNGIRVDTVDKEILTAMKEAGCFLVAFGLETGSQYILDKIDKKTTIEQGRTAVKLAKEVGLEIMPSYQIGLPFDTPETMQQTIDFAKENDTNFAQFFITTPYPGTRVRNYILEHGGTILINEWVKYGHAQGKVFYEMPTLDKETVLKYYSKAYRSFYFRPKYIWRKATDFKKLSQNINMFFKYIGNFFNRGE